MQNLKSPELDDVKRQARQRIWPLDVMYLLGLGALTVGCGAYDWRIGAIVAGTLLLVSAALGGQRL